MSTGQMIPLENLRPGERGSICFLDGPSHSLRHLQEIGLNVGCGIEMINPGPPHLIEIGELRLCVRPESDVIVLIQLEASYT